MNPSQNLRRQTIELVTPAAPLRAHAVAGHPVAVRPPLRIGVMLDSLHTPRWVEKVLRDVAGASFLDLSLVVLNANPDPPRPSTWREWLVRQREALPYRLWEWYQHADYRRFRAEAPDPFATVDATPLVAGAEILRVQPMCARFVDRFHDDDIERIKAADLDVMLRFGFRIIRGTILETARFGVWSLHHDDNREYRGGPALFWEMYERNTTSGSVLQVLTEALDGGHVIYRSLAATNFASLHKNRREVYWKTAEFMIRRLTDLWTEGWPFLQALDTYREPNTYSRPIYHRPRNRQMLRFLTRTAAHRVRQRVAGRFEERWVIALRRRDSNDPFRLVTPPPGRSYADPFLGEANGRTYILFEDQPHATRKAVISCMEIGADGVPGPAEPVLEADSHLSYPSIFRWRGDWWMVPETGRHRIVQLYRARAFPRGWTLEAPLVTGVDACDATLCEWNGRWWMFVTVAVPGGPRADELSLFYADSPLGPWRPHPRNPIVSDVQRARSGGSICRHGETLIRPAQDCSRRYGYALTFNRIERLTEREYLETPVGSFLPTWHPHVRATHTISWSSTYEAIDGRFPGIARRW